MKNKVIDLIQQNLLEIIPELEGTTISNDETFVNLGANSLDRGELITLTIEKLGLEVSRIEFVGAQTINELAELVMKNTKN
jgi:polyketide biosynthesis acyl carrier protein